MNSETIMPQIPKSRIKTLIESRIEQIESSVTGKLVDFRQRVSKESLGHALWGFCTELLDFYHLGLITYEEFGIYMHQLREIVKNDPAMNQSVWDTVQLAAGNDPFRGLVLR